MLKEVYQNPWVQTIGLLVGLALLAALVWLLSPVLVPLLFAFLVAYVLDPVVDFFEAHGMRRSIAIAGIVFVLLLALLLIPAFLIPNMITEADRLITIAAAATDAESMSDWLQRAVDQVPLEELLREIDWIEEGETNVNPLALIVLRATQYMRDNATQFMERFAGAGSAAAHVFASIGRGTYGVFLFLGSIVLFGFVTVYMLNDFDRIIASAKDFTPPKYRSWVFGIVAQIDRNIHGWLRGQLFVCLCLGAMYAIGFSLSGTPFAIPIAIFGGLASLVPYVGPVLTIVPAAVITLVEYGGFDGHVIGVLATIAAAQALEGNVLTPRIVGRQVGLHPVWVILAVLVFANALGFLGLLLAVPIAATLKVFVVEATTYYRRSPLFETEGPEDDSPDDD
ncbi:MAG: AI-2E family transporter [Nitrospiraceae bacterium]|nr:AI-2E family transporter [Nitrospiraceae bacterium]